MTAIMIVEDEAIISMQLEDRLNALGYKVVGRAFNGEEAIKMAKLLSPDIILMDIVMPGKMDGIDAADIIKRELDIPVIFITAWADDEYVNRAKISQPYGYIVKPFQVNELKAAIEVALYNINIERELAESEKHFRSMLKSIDDGIFSLSPDKWINFCNSAAERMFGYSTDEILGKPLDVFISKQKRPEIEKIIGEMLSGRDNIEFVRSNEFYGLRKDGIEFPMELTLVPGKLQSKPFITVIMRKTSVPGPTDEQQTSDDTEKPMVPICSFCKKIRDSEGEWMVLEKYLNEKSAIKLSHSVCPECIKKHYPGL